MRMPIAILAGLLMAVPPVATNAQAPSPCGPTVPVPEWVKTEKLDFNAYTGDKRIRLRPFKAIVFLPAGRDNDAELNDAIVTEEAMQRLFKAFQNKFRDDNGIEDLQPFSFEALPFTKPAVLRTTKRGRDEATWEKLAEKIQDMNIQEHDVTFLWIQTHGVNRDGRGLLQDETGEELERSRILEMIDRTADGKKPWLTVLITDRCSLPPAGDANQAKASPRPRAGDGIEKSAIWRALYFGHRGVVDIDTSSPGEAAVIDALRGSVFLNAFMDTLNSDVTPVACLQSSPESMIFWKGEGGRDFEKAVGEKVGRHSRQTPRWNLSGVHVNGPMEGVDSARNIPNPRNR